METIREQAMVRLARGLSPEQVAQLLGLAPEVVAGWAAEWNLHLRTGRTMPPQGWKGEA